MAADSQNFLHLPKPAPALNIPAGVTAKVQIVNSPAKIEVPLGVFMSPALPGHETLQAPAFTFLVEQVSSGRKLLFDLGCRKDWQNLAPTVLELISGPGWKVDIEKSMSEILQESGVDVAGGAIESIVWSHWHFDHTGDPSTFPPSTSVITGPGVKEAFLPGYPANKDSPLLETDLEGREHIVIDFDGFSTIPIGRFRAVDYFNDGSFYLLDAPGHAIGHMCGLARVTSPLEGDSEDTFIFMGADTAHHGGEFRPTEYLPIPKNISPTPYAAKYPSVCPGHIYESIRSNNEIVEPFYHINDNVPHNRDQARETCSMMEDFDAAENVFVIIAHDGSLLDERVGIEWFPHGTLKYWRKNDCANRARWGFLSDFTVAVEEAKAQRSRKVLVRFV